MKFLIFSVVLFVAYQLASSNQASELNEDLLQRLHSPLLWNRLHKPVSLGREWFEAEVNISLLCDTISVLFETKTITSSTRDELAGLCNEELEHKFVDTLDTICNQTELTSQSITSENISHSHRKRDVTVLTTVVSSILLGATGAGVVIGVGLGAVALGLAISTMLKQSEQAGQIDQLFQRTDNLAIAVKDIVTELKRIDQERRIGNQVTFDLAKASQAISSFREQYATSQTIPSSFLEYLKIGVRIDPLDAALLKSCHLDRTSKVKKLRMTFSLNKIDPALHLYEAVPIDQLVSGSDRCLIVYTGPPQIIYDSRDQKYCPISEVINTLPSPYSDIRAVNNADCYPRRSIYSSFQFLAIECSGEPIDLESLIRIRQTDDSLVIYCHGFFYSRRSSKANGKRVVNKRCPQFVFALPLGTEVTIYSNGNQTAYHTNETVTLLRSNVSLGGDLNGALFALSDNDYSQYDHILRRLDDEHQVQQANGVVLSWIVIALVSFLIVVLSAIRFHLARQ